MGHAFAKHIESLQLPPSLEEKFGRLVGATELEKGPASKTRLDVPPGYRNDVLRGKQVIIGCGGGFHQECSQPYSPVARMEEVDMALNDEGQQHRNLDESSAIARVPRKGLVVWCGDHKQTPGGLRKGFEICGFGFVSFWLPFVSPARLVLVGVCFGVWFSCCFLFASRETSASN